MSGVIASAAVLASPLLCGQLHVLGTSSGLVEASERERERLETLAGEVWRVYRVSLFRGSNVFGCLFPKSLMLLWDECFFFSLVGFVPAAMFIRSMVKTG